MIGSYAFSELFQEITKAASILMFKNDSEYRNRIEVPIYSHIWIDQKVIIRSLKQPKTV